jgi:hypothetical protein
MPLRAGAGAVYESGMAPSRKSWTFAFLACLVTLASCATTQETVQQCRKNAYSFCDRTVGSKTADPAGRSTSFQQCLDTQVAACGTP